MNFKKIFLAMAFSAATAGAQATVLTFDDLTALVYGNGDPLLSSMRYTAAGLSYVEQGYLLTLNAPDAVPGAAHINDGTYQSQTFNWHDGFDNGAGAFVSLSRVDGGRFDLLGFDYFSDTMTVTAEGRIVGRADGAGSWTTPLLGIRELRFSSGMFNGIDNVAVEPTASVPLPGTAGLMLVGLLAAVGARTRRDRRDRRTTASTGADVCNPAFPLASHACGSAV